MNLATWAERNGIARVTAYRDMTEILTSMCARLYGKRAAQNRARRWITAAAADDCEAA
jgi:predicted site-specific integrase-resolvase